jgi:hypothetical protein
MHVDEAALQAAIAKTIIDGVTDDARRDMFLAALKQHLFTEDYQKKTQLSKLFEEAVRKAVISLMEKCLTEPDIKARLDEEVHKGVELVLAEGKLQRAVYEKLVRNISSSF